MTSSNFSANNNSSIDAEFAFNNNTNTTEKTMTNNNTSQNSKEICDASTTIDNEFDLNYDTKVIFSKAFSREHPTFLPH